MLDLVVELFVFLKQHSNIVGIEIEFKMSDRELHLKIFTSKLKAATDRLI
jgi:hypothetical protein